MEKKRFDFTETENFLNKDFSLEDMKVFVLDSGLKLAEIGLADKNQIQDINEIAGNLRLCYQILCTIKKQ